MGRNWKSGEVVEGGPVALSSGVPLGNDGENS